MDGVTSTVKPGKEELKSHLSEWRPFLVSVNVGHVTAIVATKHVGGRQLVQQPDTGRRHVPETHRSIFMPYTYTTRRLCVPQLNKYCGNSFLTRSQQTGLSLYLQTPQILSASYFHII